MASHGYNEYDDFDLVDADGYSQYESYAMRRAPQQSTVHTTQQMTTKVAPAYDGRNSFFAFEDAIDDWCDITELEAEKSGPALRNRLEGDAAQYKRLRPRTIERSSRRCELLQKILATSCRQGSPDGVFVSIHVVHETE